MNIMEALAKSYIDLFTDTLKIQHLECSAYQLVKPYEKQSAHSEVILTCFIQLLNSILHRPQDIGTELYGNYTIRRFGYLFMKIPNTNKRFQK